MRKKLSIEDAFKSLRERGYEITYHHDHIFYTVTDGDRSAIRSVAELVMWASTGRDPHNWLPTLA
jgi:hypothetical protein